MSRIDREKERRKQEMMQAAEILFANKGFENVTMEEIAKESEFTRKTLYAYFKDKDDLYRQVFLRIAVNRWKFLVLEMKKAENGLPRLLAFGKANYDYTIANPKHFKLIVHIDQKGFMPKTHDANFIQRIEQARKEINELLYDIYTFEQERGVIRCDINIKRNIVQLGMSLRTMLNEIVLGYEGEEFYFDFLNLFLDAIKCN